MVQLVITLPENTYNEVMEGKDTSNTIIYEAIRKGNVLPKGHGRLIDADALEKKMCDREVELGDDEALWESSAVSVALDMFAPTIIEADTESEDKE